MPFPRNETTKSMQKFFSSSWVRLNNTDLQPISISHVFAQLYAPFATLKSQTFVRLPLAKVVLLVAYETMQLAALAGEWNTKVDDVNTVNRFETWRLER